MLRFNANDFTYLCFHVERLQGECLWDPSEPSAKEEEAEWRKSVKSRLYFLKLYAEKLGLNATVGQSGRISEQALGGVGVETICYLLRDLEATLVGEMAKPVFLALRGDLSKFYDEDDKAFWGDEVHKGFPKSAHDIGEASRCFALERWDACVHHLMRAVEHAIRKWAKDLKLKTKLPLDLENLEQILQASESKHKEVKQQKKTRKRDVDLKYVAETSGHFGFIKDAWRNPGAHARETYDERKANNLMVHVEAFMRLLASRKTPVT